MTDGRQHMIIRLEIDTAKIEEMAAAVHESWMAGKRAEGITSPAGSRRTGKS